MKKSDSISILDKTSSDAIRVALGPIVQRNPETLKAYPHNPRKHRPKQITQVKGSIRRYGVTKPILITEASEIVAGHAVVEAAKQLKLKTVPTLCLSDLSADQIREYRIADNQLAEGSSWDMTLLGDELRAIIETDAIFCVEAMGFDIPEVELLLDAGADNAQQDPADDPVPGPSSDIITMPGDLWLLGEHRLLCGSSLQVESWMRLMNGEIAQVAFVDPPYNVPISGHVSGLGKVKHEPFLMATGEMSESEFIAFNIDWLGKMLPHLAEGAVAAICMDWRHAYELQTAAREAGIDQLNLCVWNKSNAGLGSLYRSKHELVFIYRKGKTPHINNVELGAHGRYRTNVWDYAGANAFGKTRMTDLADHPTVKPVAMVAEYLRDISNPGQIVLDAFLGSGTTLLAAERTHRRARGIEIAPKYVDVAIRRWETMTGREVTLADDGRTFAEIADERLKASAVA